MQKPRSGQQRPFMFQTARKNRQEGRKADLRGKKILLVDDEGPASMNRYRLLLETAGYSVIHCAGSLAALFAVVRVEPDLVLTALRKPVMNGLALATELKSNRDTRHIPVVMVAAQDVPKCCTDAFEAGCDGYLADHLSARSFLEGIAKILRPPESKRTANLLEERNARNLTPTPVQQHYEAGNPNSAPGRRRL